MPWALTKEEEEEEMTLQRANDTLSVTEVIWHTVKSSNINS
jgi:hypothetical protein